MESDELGLIWFRRQLSDGWRAGSVLQDDLAPEEMTLAEVVEGCEAFIEAVDRWVWNNLHVEVDDVLA